MFINSITIYSQTNERYGNIYGTIIDSVSKEPVWACLKIVNLEDSSLYDVCTENDGTFKITKIPIGKYDIKIIALGYFSKIKKDIVVKAGEKIELNEVVRDYAYYGEDKAKEELSKGIVHLWIGGLVITAEDNSSIPDSVRKAVIDKYGGFEYILIGCDPSGAKEHNAIVEEYLEKKNGKGWREKMSEEIEKLEEYYKNKE